MANKHELPPLPYAYDALEPYIDEQTMRLHHDKHHLGYVNGLNKAEEMLAQARESGDYGLVKHWSREAAFHGSGHFLHSIFWPNMAPPGNGGGGLPTGELAGQIDKDFGSFEKFKAHFGAAAKAVEGSGWGLLVWEPELGQLQMLQAEKHQNLTQWIVTPLLVLDVWEHAYYLKYQNNRGAYVDAWWNVVNWADVAERFRAARG
ncbi:MAG: superoxide dismutase [Anaerolineae bacterium]|nr:superoxide dismutase [Anaerolineae bacterium]